MDPVTNLGYFADFLKQKKLYSGNRPITCAFLEKQGSERRVIPMRDVSRALVAHLTEPVLVTYKFVKPVNPSTEEMIDCLDGERVFLLDLEARCIAKKGKEPLPEASLGASFEIAILPGQEAMDIPPYMKMRSFGTLRFSADFPGQPKVERYFALTGETAFEDYNSERGTNALETIDAIAKEYARCQHKIVRWK